jgi:hypothetical protein
VEDLPDLPLIGRTAGRAADHSRRPGRHGTAVGPQERNDRGPLRLLRVGAAVLAAAVISGACSSSTGGTALPQPSAPSRPAPSPTTQTHSPAAAPPSAAVSDEDQVRETVRAFNDAYNTQNWAAYTELMCAAMRAQFTSVVMDYVKKNRATTGANTIKAIAVTISADSATAKITGANEAVGSGTITLPLKREDGWKVCQIYHP